MTIELWDAGKVLNTEQKVDYSNFPTKISFS